MPTETTSISILIVEDDASFALELEMLIQDIGYQVAGVADSAASALEEIYSKRVDFILMDVDIKGKMTGLELGKKIRPIKIPILYITSFGTKEHYEEAQKSNIVGYLVKPIDKYTLQTAISLAVGQLFAALKDGKQLSADEFLFEEYLFLKKDSVYHKVAERDIMLVEGSDDYVKIRLFDGRSFILRKTLQIMERALSEALFIRVHRSYLINVTAIEQLDTQDNLLLVGDTAIPLSRKRRLELEKLIRKVE
ncbi:MAG TPA: response regulator transcription factor [Saprospiraceae bacterium]|nr:response regulator transcription factor [Saprospiraceae bacterium]HRK80406.1 response regulator transcription factor [Saprospiraceae bacterium]